MSNGKKNSIGDFLRFTFSTLVNKDDEIFKALFANPDDESGVIETIFNQLEASRDEWCNNSDIYNQTGEMLDKSLSFFSILERLYEETDESYRDRNALLFWRQGDELWGDTWNIRKIFQSYFGTDFVFIVNNTSEMEDNLIINGDFENKTGWELDECSYDAKAKFSGKMGVLFDSSGICKQNISVEMDSVYFLHFFVKGTIKAEIKDDNGRFWNNSIGEYGEWQESPFISRHSVRQWDAANIFFITDEIIKSVTISFIGDSGEALLDYVRLFKKDAYSSFTVIVSVGNKYTKDTLSMAPGTSDPDNHIANYEKMSYVEQSHILGTIGVRPEGVYHDILEAVRPGGISAYIEILSKD